MCWNSNYSGSSPGSSFSVLSYMVCPLSTSLLHAIQTIVQSWWSGITIPVSLLSSAMHPDLHPRFLVRSDNEGSETDENSPLLSNNNDHGYPIDREEIQRILGEDHLDDAISINSGQRQQLVGEGGLKKWGRGKLSVYDEGSCLMICDQDGEWSMNAISVKWKFSWHIGNVSVRKINKKSSNAWSSSQDNEECIVM